MSKRKVLYVDDEDINLKLFELTFRNEFEVKTALSAADGLDILENDSDIRLVLSDLRMPEMDGLQFIKVIKEKDSKVTCMLLTGFIESDVMLEGFNKELLYRYLTKPWKKAALLDVINEAFDKQVV